MFLVFLILLFFLTHANLAKNAKISFIAGFLVSHRSHEPPELGCIADSSQLVGLAECFQPDGTYERKRCMLS